MYTDRSARMITRSTHSRNRKLPLPVFCEPRKSRQAEREGSLTREFIRDERMRDKNCSETVVTRREKVLGDRKKKKKKKRKLRRKKASRALDKRARWNIYVLTGR